MPLDEAYGPQIYSSNADLCNVRLPSLPLPSPALPSASNQFLWFVKTIQETYIFRTYDVQSENGAYIQLIEQQNI